MGNWGLHFSAEKRCYFLLGNCNWLQKNCFNKIPTYLPTYFKFEINPIAWIFLGIQSLNINWTSNIILLFLALIQLELILKMQNKLPYKRRRYQEEGVSNYYLKCTTKNKQVKQKLQRSKRGRPGVTINKNVSSLPRNFESCNQFTTILKVQN